MTEPLSYDYLLAYATSQQQGKSPYVGDLCAGCSHEFHGLPCTKHRPVHGPRGTEPCPCPGVVEEAS